MYGVVTHYVNRRRRDWVIRMALGMKPLDAVRQVVARGMLLALAGCAIGVIIALAGTHVLASLLYEVRPGDPAALAAVVAALLTAVLLAALIPALRAARADPAHVLRDVP